MKVLQANCNRTSQSQDLALATASKLKADMIIISEPNKNSVKHRKDWICDENLDAAIKVLNKDLVIIKQGKGSGFSYITTRELTLYSCYASPNRDIENLEDILTEISRMRLPKKAIIAGDFNGKSPQWGMNITDARGRVITEWIAQNDLVVLNEGTTPTFQRRDQSSILDLTLATPDVKKTIKKWEVSDEESLSDHKFIIFETVQNDQLISPAMPERKGWQTKKLDTEKLKTVTPTIVSEHLTGKQRFSEVLKQICDATMPKKKTCRRGKPVYWWTEEINNLRKLCVQKRREHQRMNRKGRTDLCSVLWGELKDLRKQLKYAIKKSKHHCWKELCDNLDCDIWGDGYKIVMKGMIGFPPKIQLTAEKTEEIVDHLFPNHESLCDNKTVIFDCNNDNVITDGDIGPVIFSPFTREELKLASERIKKDKAPGPGCIPGEVLKFVAQTEPDYVLGVYNELAKQGNFPEAWKRAKLVLLRKGVKPIDDPSSFRPICLLDVEGKLYELLILARLKQEINKTGGFSEWQYGFREGKQTVDAINEVIKIAKEAANFPHKRRKLCVMITLDIKNAFNSASWDLIYEVLKNRKVDSSVLRLLKDYFSGRKILMEAEGKTRARGVNRGVPQGSILGPTLWNTLYDGLLRLEQPEGVRIIGFADDIAVIATAMTEEELMLLANIAISRISYWIRNNKLRLAPDKTEAVLLTTRRKIQHIQFEVEGTSIHPSNAIKYLGVWIDTKLTFKAHIMKSLEKAEKTMTALSKLMPNVAGPRASKRKALSSVIHSQILYAAPSWHHVINSKKLLRKLVSIQRTTTIRVATAYRTISADGVGVIAGTPPIDLLIKEREAIYKGTRRKEARNDLLLNWQMRWDSGTKGRWTHRLIPNVQKWLERPYGEVDYYMTQALSGHGDFQKYLFDRGKAEAPTCPYCESSDDVEHTLFKCRRWEQPRDEYTRVSGVIFNENAFRSGLTTTEKDWKDIYSTVRKILEQKQRRQ